jgi:hypothetical protein
MEAEALDMLESPFWHSGKCAFKLRSHQIKGKVGNVLLGSVQSIEQYFHLAKVAFSGQYSEPHQSQRNTTALPAAQFYNHRIVWDPLCNLRGMVFEYFDLIACEIVLVEVRDSLEQLQTRVVIEQQRWESLWLTILGLQAVKNQLLELDAGGIGSDVDDVGSTGVWSDGSHGCEGARKSTQ